MRLRDPDGGQLVLACVVPSRSSTCPATPGPRATRGRRARDARRGPRRASARHPRRRARPSRRVAARGLTELAEAEGADLSHRLGRRRTAGRIGLDPHRRTAAAGRTVRGRRRAARRSRHGPFRHVGVALDGSAEAAAALAVGYAIAHDSNSAMTLYAPSPETSESVALHDAPHPARDPGAARRRRRRRPTRRQPADDAAPRRAGRPRDRRRLRRHSRPL